MIRASAEMWLRDFHCDGLRFDSANDLPADVVKELTFSLREAYPGRILTAEVTPENPMSVRELGFDSVWVHSGKALPPSFPVPQTVHRTCREQMALITGGRDNWKLVSHVRYLDFSIQYNSTQLQLQEQLFNFRLFDLNFSTSNEFDPTLF